MRRLDVDRCGALSGFHMVLLVEALQTGEVRCAGRRALRTQEHGHAGGRFLPPRRRALSYAGCGLPYYIAGVVHEKRELAVAPLGAVRDPVFFQNLKNVRVMKRTEAVEINRVSRS